MRKIDKMNKTQPVYLNLFKIKLPLPGIISLLHRVTGVVLFLAIPFSMYLLQLSMHDATDFQRAVDLLNHPLALFFEVIIFAALIYHLFAGIRFLLMDIDIGEDKKPAETSSWMVLGATTFSSLIFISMRLF